MKAIVYTKENCLECERAKSLLKSKNIEYLEYFYGKDFDRRAFVAEFGERAEFPQIAIGYKHIGGLKETLQYLQKEKII